MIRKSLLVSAIILTSASCILASPQVNAGNAMGVPVSATDASIYVPINETRRQQVYGCFDITNNSPTGKEVYVPLHMQSEWDGDHGIKTRPPTGVSIADCPVVCTGGEQTGVNGVGNLNGTVTYTPIYAPTVCSIVPVPPVTGGGDSGGGDSGTIQTAGDGGGDSGTTTTTNTNSVNGCYMHVACPAGVPGCISAANASSGIMACPATSTVNCVQNGAVYSCTPATGSNCTTIPLYGSMSGPYDILLAQVACVGNTTTTTSNTGTNTNVNNNSSGSSYSSTAGTQSSTGAGVSVGAGAGTQQGQSVSSTGTSQSGTGSANSGDGGDGGDGGN